MELKDRLNAIILTVQINHKHRKMVGIATNRIIEIVEEEIRKVTLSTHAADAKELCDPEWVWTEPFTGGYYVCRKCKALRR